MKLEKAIEILEQHQKGTDPLYLSDLPDAEKLGIEALKRLEDWRAGVVLNPSFMLLGETED